jgi:membrane protein insertase Oxa1/YidC/SpoIIIJ
MFQVARDLIEVAPRSFLDTFHNNDLVLSFPILHILVELILPILLPIAVVILTFFPQKRDKHLRVREFKGL